MLGIIILLFWFSMVLKTEHRQDTLLLDFKEISMASKIFIVIVFGISIWGIGVSEFWKGLISIDTFIEFLNSSWFIIGICALSGFILLENICHKPFFIIRNNDLRKGLYVVIGILFVVTVIFDFLYLYL